MSAATMSTTTTTAFKNDPAIIKKVLQQSKTIAVVGASNKAERPSNYVSKFLIDKGYTVIPVNPGLEGQEIHGQKVYPTLSSIDVPVDMVDIFRASDAVPPIVEEAIKINAKCVWMQEGVVNEDAAMMARNAGLDVVMNTCPKVQIPLLGIVGPTSNL
jgi:predicted CoA-binding protein